MVIRSEMVELGGAAPPFDLPAANPEVDRGGAAHRRLDDYAGAEALVVAFTCNHCPYARHVEAALISVARDYAARNVQVVAVSPNDPAQYPEDSFASMAARARAQGYPFPYLYDESQDVARAYGAVCTPDLFVFDRDRRLVYRGRLDETRPGAGTATGRELRAALDQLLETGAVTLEQYPAIGCNIKWR
jgi:peroxiredoxin